MTTAFRPYMPAPGEDATIRILPDIHIGSPVCMGVDHAIPGADCAVCAVGHKPEKRKMVQVQINGRQESLYAGLTERTMNKLKKAALRVKKEKRAVRRVPAKSQQHKGCYVVYGRADGSTETVPHWAYDKMDKVNYPHFTYVVGPHVARWPARLRKAKRRMAALAKSAEVVRLEAEAAARREARRRKVEL
jgi:hypothetical protein